jgi:spore coat polysaccharide biosynthesis protein SpsF
MNFLKKKYKTEQENFWNTKFGNEYTNRNLKINKLKFIGKNLINNNIKIKNAIELGANVGLNLDAIKRIYPKCKTYGVEINYNAYKILEKKHLASNASILEFNISYKFDLVILSLVLIHQNPIFLNKIYQKIYKLSSKYIYIAEYFNPTPVALNYRGHKNKLFKRDFAKELWTKFPNLKLINYGFHWSEDPFFDKNTCDNETWFLFKK